MHEVVGGSLLGKLIFFFFLRAFIRAAARILSALQPDLIWANWWIPPGLVAERISGKSRCPVVLSSHGTDIGLLVKSETVNKVGRKVYRKASRASVVSEFLKARLLASVDTISDDRVEVIPMPVGVEHFPKAELPNNDPPVFLSVARFTKQKRLSDIIEALAILRKRGVECRVIFLGEGPLESDLRERAGKLGVADMTEFHTLVAQQILGRYYRDSDGVLLVSENEGFGLVLVEAGLSGRPVIATRSGGIPDIVDDGANGILVDVGDVEEIADALQSLVTNKDKRRRLGDEGHRMAMERFAPSVLVDRIDQLFRSAVRGPQ
jgi:glycosyltransferase involved in cell wall biosynthesis